MYGVIIGLIIVIAVVLVLIVLAQNPKGGGLSSQFGGGGASQVMGVKKTGDFLEKATWASISAILLLSLATNFFLDTSAPTGPSSPNLDSTPTTAPVPSLDLGTEEALPLEDLTSGGDSTQ